MKEHLQNVFQEDYNTHEKPNIATGPCYQVALLVHDVLEGALAAIVEHINESFESILDDQLDYSGVGYRFRNAFECVSWLEHGAYQPDLFWLKLDVWPKVERAVTDAVSTIDVRDTEILIAWYWSELDFGRDKRGVIITALKDADVFTSLVPFLMNIVKEQMKSTCEFVAGQIEVKRKELEQQEEQRRREFEYDDEDGYILCVLQDLCDACPGNAVLEKAVSYVERFLDKDLPDDAEPCRFTISYRNNGESNYFSFDLDEDSLSIYSGGYDQSDCGGDSYGSEVFRLNAYSHADIESYNLADEILELIHFGAEIKAGEVLE